MKAPQQNSTSQKLTGEIQLARIRLAKAENQLKSAKQQARMARRRRKEAKQAARRAKKQTKLAKQELAEAKLALAEAEEKLLLSRKHAARTKTKKAATKKPTTKKPTTLARRKHVARPMAASAPKSVKSEKPAPSPRKPRLGLKPKVGGMKQSITVPRDLEATIAPASMPSGAEEPPAATTEMSVEPTPPENQSE